MSETKKEAPHRLKPSPDIQANLLVLDTGSPQASVALRLSTGEVIERSGEAREHSEKMLGWIDECLDEASLDLPSIGGLIALRGPGSFTGLRIGLATAIGLCQTLGIPAAAVGTLEVLARAESSPGDGEPSVEAGDGTAKHRGVVSVVDALRGEWFSQLFKHKGPHLEPTEEPLCRTPSQLAELAPARIIGIGIEDRLASESWPAGCEIIEASPLAAVVARDWQQLRLNWDPSLLSQPLYFRQPAATPLSAQPKRS